MKSYEVTITATIVENIHVEADHEFEAEKKAYAIFRANYDPQRTTITDLNTKCRELYKDK